MPQILTLATYITKLKSILSKNLAYLRHLSSSYLLLGVNSATMFFLTPVLWGQLGAEQYGIWVLLSGIVGYFQLSGLGFSQNFLMEIIRHREHAGKVNRLVNTLFFSLLFFTLATLPVFVVLQMNLDNFFNIHPAYARQAAQAFVLVYGIFVISFISQGFYNILFAVNQLFLRNIIESGRILASFIGTYWLATHGYGIVPIGAVQLASFLVFYLIIYIISKHALRFKIGWQYFDGGTFKAFLVPSTHFFIISLASQLVLYSDSIIISALMGTSYVGLYTITLRIPEFLTRLIFKFSDIKIPKITALHQENKGLELWLLHNRLMLITMGTAVPVAMAIILFGKWIIKLWMGNKFDIDQSLLTVFCLHLVFQSYYHVIGIFLQCFGLLKKLSLYSLAGAVLNVLLAIWLNKHLGLLGIGMALLISQFFVGLVLSRQFYGYMFEHYSRVSLFKLKA